MQRVQQLARDLGMRARTAQDQNHRPNIRGLREELDGEHLYQTVRDGWARESAAGARRLLIVRTCVHAPDRLVETLLGTDAATVSSVQIEQRNMKYLNLIEHCVDLGAEARDILDVVLNELGIAQLNEDPYQTRLHDVASQLLLKAVRANQPQLVKKLVLAGAKLDFPDRMRVAIPARGPTLLHAAIALEENECLRMIISNVNSSRPAHWICKAFLTSGSHADTVARFVDAGIVPLMYAIRHQATGLWDELLLRAHMVEGFETVMTDIVERKLCPTVPSREFIARKYSHESPQKVAALIRTLGSTSSGYSLTGEPEKLCVELLEADPKELPSAELKALIGSDARLPADWVFDESLHIIERMKAALITENAPLIDAFLAAGAAELMFLRTCSIHAFSLYRLAIQFGASGHVGLVERLVQAGVECPPCVVDGAKVMALIDFPVAKTDARILKLMVEHIFDPLFLNRKFGNVLHWACVMGRSDVVELMIPRVSDVNIPSPQGATALGIAANMNLMPIARLLLDAGADVDFCVAGRTPLFVALLPPLYGTSHKDPLSLATSGARSKVDKTEMIGLLLQRGADSSRKCPNGRTWLDLAQESGYISERILQQERYKLAKKSTALKNMRGKEGEPVRTVTEADAKQAEDAAQALLAEEDSKPTTISKTGATAKTNKKKSKQKKREDKKRAGTDTDASHNDSVDGPSSRHDDAASTPPTPEHRTGPRNFVGDMLQREMEDLTALDDLVRRADVFGDNLTGADEFTDKLVDSDDELTNVSIDEDVNSLESPDGNYDPRDLSRPGVITNRDINDGVVEQMRDKFLHDKFEHLAHSAASSRDSDHLTRVGNTMMLNNNCLKAARPGDWPWPESEFAYHCCLMQFEVRTAARRVNTSIV